MSAVQVKAGQTFQVSCTVTGNDGALIDLSDYAINAQIRDALGNLVTQLSTRKPANAVGIVNVWADTKSWPLGRFFCDLQFVRPDGVIQFSETFSIVVSASVTHMGV
ncbi:hypothetical protein [Neokomagataea anthophila]|uniref:Phage tail protein n=1 Tax=Neokomagataea anthophila TaxID=2826925 RepID=A0ABS5E6G1_9PROT|nr:hypothetical protein [Neokomagataea anthophila]MBR0559487.1 hypothetical protein [Neokomagataea anthophila]